MSPDEILALRTEALANTPNRRSTTTKDVRIADILRYRRAPDVPVNGEVLAPPREPPPPRNETVAEREARLQTALALAFARDRATLEETLAQRVRVAHRIVRELARLRSLVAEDETLAQGLIPQPSPVPQPDPWLTPTPVKFPVPGRAGQNAQATPVIEQMLKAEQLPPRWQPCPGHFGIPLVPPDVPPALLDPTTQKPVEDYDETKDIPLMTWTRIVRGTAGYLAVEKTFEGQIGLDPLVDPRLARLAWPSRLEILYWEEALIARVLDILKMKGTPGATTWLTEEGYSKHEINPLIRMALTLNYEETGFDQEHERAIMAAQLEDYIQRAREAENLRAELNGFKQLAQIKGLTRTTPEDELRMFTKMVTKLDQDDEAKFLLELKQGSPTAPGLPAPGP